MEETYCIKDKRVTPCVEPSGFLNQIKMEENNFIVIVLFVE